MHASPAEVTCVARATMKVEEDFWTLFTMQIWGNIVCTEVS